MIKLKDFDPKDFKMEDNIFNFSTYIDLDQFINDIIQKNINKSIDEINKDDADKITDAILNLKTNEILYSMSALIDYHSMNDIYEKYNSTVIETIELVLSNHKFDKFRDIFYAILEDENISIIENFEKEYNLTIINDF